MRLSSEKNKEMMELALENQRSKNLLNCIVAFQTSDEMQFFHCMYGYFTSYVGAFISSLCDENTITCSVSFIISESQNRLPSFDVHQKPHIVKRMSFVMKYTTVCFFYLF